MCLRHEGLGGFVSGLHCGAGLSAEDISVVLEVEREIAADRATWAARDVIHRALTARNDLLQADLAGRLGVSKGRVSQVLWGEGDPSIATLARYLRVLGYDLRLEAVPAESSVPPVDSTHRDR